jgi:predicted transcriptional regulator
MTPQGTIFMSNKELVLEAVNELADDAPLDEFAQRIQILDAIRRGERAADSGQFITHEELKARVTTWTTK